MPIFLSFIKNFGIYAIDTENVTAHHKRDLYYIDDIFDVQWNIAQEMTTVWNMLNTVLCLDFKIS